MPTAVGVLSCDSSGGNGAVIEGPADVPDAEGQVDRRFGVTFAAIGREFHNYGGGYEEISENATTRTR